MYKMKIEPESPSEDDKTPPWQKREPVVIDVIEIKDDDQKVSTALPRPAFEPMRFPSTAAFEAHLKQVDALVERVKRIFELKKYNSQIEVHEKLLIQMEADLRNYPSFLLPDVLQRMSDQMSRVRRYIFSLQNLKYKLLWNGMCERLKSEPKTANNLSARGAQSLEPTKMETASPNDPRVSESQKKGTQAPSEIPSTSDCQGATGSNNPVPGTSQESRDMLEKVDAAELSIRKSPLEENATQKPDESKLAEKDGKTAESSKMYSEENDLPLGSPITTVVHNRKDWNYKIPRKNTAPDGLRQDGSHKQLARDLDTLDTSFGYKNPSITKRWRKSENYGFPDEYPAKKRRPLESRLQFNIDLRRYADTASHYQPPLRRQESNISYTRSHGQELAPNQRKLDPSRAEKCDFGESDHHQNYCKQKLKFCKRNDLCPSCCRRTYDCEC